MEKLITINGITHSGLRLKFFCQHFHFVDRKLYSAERRSIKFSFLIFSRSCPELWICCAWNGPTPQREVVCATQLLPNYLGFLQFMSTLSTRDNFSAFPTCHFTLFLLFHLNLIINFPVIYKLGCFYYWRLFFLLLSLDLSTKLSAPVDECK